MKKTGKLILSIFLVIFSLTGCPSPNTTKEPENQPEQNNQEENEQIENTQKMEIKINEFSIWPSEKGSYNKETGLLEMQGEWQGAKLLTDNLETKGKYLCFEYTVLEGRLRFGAKYDDDTDDSISCQLTSKVQLPLSGTKKVKEIWLYCTSEKVKVKINKIYFSDERSIDSPVVDATATPVSFNNSISSKDFVKKMAYGVNLGNYFDSWGSLTDGLGVCLDWGQPLTTQDMIKSLETSGVKTIRIPVTWFNHIIDDKYTIDPQWMKMVKEVVDWAYSEGYYVILNTHHDVHDKMTSPIKYHEGYILRNNQADIEESERFLKAVWEQICTAFNNSYNEHLIFETLNEPRNTDHTSTHWDCLKGCPECENQIELANRFNQLCLDTIRESGGNNAKRFVLIPNAADSHRSALDNNDFKMPADISSANDKLILTLHHYPLNDHLWKSQSWDLSLMEEEFSKLNEKFIEKGIPIVMGEIGPCGTDSIEKALGRPLTEEEAYAPCSDLTKIAAKYGMSVIMFPREYGLGNLDFTKRLVNEYLETAKTNEDENEIIIGNNFWIAEGQGSYDTDTQTLQLTQQYADFALTPEYEAKGNYICIEYENLEGMLILCAIYDEGDNNFYNEGNPDSTLTLKAADTKAYLRLEESNLKISKKIKIKLHRRNKDGEAKIKIKKIYFTDKTYIADEERKQPVVDTASPVSFDNSISAVNLVKDMGVGFNLGNCYEAYNSMEDDADAYLYWDGAGYWKSYTMSKDVIEDLAAKFGKDSKGKSNAKSIRIPVTWFNHIIDDKYTIDPNWMETVKQAVDCAYELGFYVILNSHHDIRPNMNSPLKYHEGYIARNTAADIAESERFLKAIWEQITKAFNNSYDEHLIFETMNEPGNRHEHWGVQKGCSICQDSARLVNQYNQLVLDTIRASGGNNAKRFVLIPNVCCQFDSGLYNDVSLEADVFKMPADTAQDKLILTVHKYPMWDHLWKEEENDYPDLEAAFENLNKNFVEKGIPVVIGEIGPTSNADINNKDSLPYKLGHVLTAEEVLPPLSDLAKLAGKYGICILDFHLSDLFLQINGKYIPGILADDWTNAAQYQ